ncbi:DUF4097 domain-containing protein [Clostridium botulinum]|nr:DUF4097 domain-containing protein [Clostridium botulinum]
MKRMVALLVCLVLGVTCLTGCANNNETFTPKSYTTKGEEITEVCIDVRDRQIEVMQSPDSQVHIDYFESSKEYYDISVSDSHTLTMTAKSDKEWTDYIGSKSAAGSRKISVQLPDRILTRLKLSTTNEDISLSALTVVGDISLSSQGGDIVFDKLNVKNTISINAKNGDVSGSIIGSYDDYAISCDIKKGKSNLPSSKENGTKTLMVSNNNGDIDIEFINE